ncbi:MAG: selenide, water dikinase SelD [Cumulibacter sp.]
MSGIQLSKRLTEFSHGGGCACKLAPGELANVLDDIDQSQFGELIVGTETGDDAAVWRLDAERALISTTDFITPLVDDPYLWGRVSATNAISDVYAMGGRPLFALNLVAWPSTELPTDMLREVVRGGLSVGAENGFAIVGGHSVDDPEPKYGLAVTGEAHPDRLLRNTGLRAGDQLILTKPLGVGVTTTAIKLGRAGQSLVDEAIGWMTTANGDAARIALEHGATGATDVTGFGLLGHLSRLTVASMVDATINADEVLFFDGVAELATDGVVPGGSRRNLEWVSPLLSAEGKSEPELLMLADAQTSGGLLFGVAADQVDSALRQCAAAGLRAAAIGSVTAGSGRITVA